MKIYIVDDDPDMCALMSVLLEHAGHRVSSHQIGTFAISEIAAQSPDCVLLDLMMPELDGTELLGELKKRPELSRTRFVAVSGNTSELWRKRMLTAGAIGYITKPIDPDTFASTVEKMIADAG